jgi:hypothetical protein
MTTAVRQPIFALAVGAALLIGACSGSSPAAPTSAGQQPPTAATEQPSVPPAVGPTGAATGGTVDSCSLLTQAEVDTAAGGSLGPGAQAGALDDCQWSNSDFTGSVELEVGDWTAIKAESLASGETLTAVPGVGDEAWTFNAAGNAAQLYVRKGTTGFKLLLGGGQYIGSLADLGLAQEKALAAAVLGRL